MSLPRGVAATFGRYALRRRLAWGGMAEIWLAEQERAQPPTELLVLKLMLPHLAEEPALVEMFLDEARLAAALSHQNIARVFDFGEIEGRYFLAMEYLHGKDLGAIRERAAAAGERVPMEVALAAAARLCDGLHHAHEHRENDRPLGIVHRDVSPENVMLTLAGEVKLLDFGVARVETRTEERSRTGVVKGKAAYCSPEQLEGGVIDRRADVFSTAVVLHELLTGKRLFKRESEPATLLAVLEAEIPRPSAERPELPRELDDVLLAALDRDPGRRPETASELGRALERFVTGAPPGLGEYVQRLFPEHEG